MLPPADVTVHIANPPGQHGPDAPIGVFVVGKDPQARDCLVGWVWIEYRPDRPPLVTYVCPTLDESRVAVNCARGERSFDFRAMRTDPIYGAQA